MDRSRLFRTALLIALSVLAFYHVHAAYLPASPAASQQVTSHPSADYKNTLSGNGQYMAFVSERSGNPDIWLKSLAHGIVALPRALTHYTGEDTDPALNQQGDRLLYVSNKSDPRGDIYLLDINTGKETKLTDLSSEDSSPKWSNDGPYFYYLKRDLKTRQQRLYRQSINDHSAVLIVSDALSFSIGNNGSLVYSNGIGLQLIEHPNQPNATPKSLTSGYLDLWPQHRFDAEQQRQQLVFSRYLQDSNGDGQINTEDESSIWLGQWDAQWHRQLSLYQITSAGHFHLNPVVDEHQLFFSDLKQGDIFQVHLKDVFSHYTNVQQAETTAIQYSDNRDYPTSLMMLANISRNLSTTLSRDEARHFDFNFIEQLIARQQFPLAIEMLTPYQVRPLRPDAQLYQIVLEIQKNIANTSIASRKKWVNLGTKKLVALSESHAKNQPYVAGQALIEAARLYQQVNDLPSALDSLIQVEKLNDNDIKAKALFMRGKIYQHLHSTAAVTDVFIKVINLFGETSGWGKRAIQQVIRATENSMETDKENKHSQIAVLFALISRHSELPQLVNTVRFRIVQHYDELGEQQKAIKLLNDIIDSVQLSTHKTSLSSSTSLKKAYLKKAALLSQAEQYTEAALVYDELVSTFGSHQDDYQQVQQLLILQKVRLAQQQSDQGELRIATKMFKHIAQAFPDSVEAHRGYITTKAQLGEAQAAKTYYQKLLEQSPDDPVFIYAETLANSYSTPSPLSTVAQQLEQAITINPSIAYFHQTLGWAYENLERLSHQPGYYEKSRAEYHIALAQNDEFLFPENESNLLLNLGNVNSDLENYPEAFRYYQQRERRFAPKKNNLTEWQYRKSYGKASFHSGHNAEAIRQYQQAITLTPSDKPLRKAEIYDQIGLVYQDAGEYPKAVTAFSTALTLTLAHGNPKNIAKLQRNIGVSLYRIADEKEQMDSATRSELKKALNRYFESLASIENRGMNKKKTGSGLINVEVGLSDNSSQAARGFDVKGEKKLLFSYIANTYEKLNEPAPAYAYFLKKWQLLDQSDSPSVPAQTERAVVLNHLGILAYSMGRSEEALSRLSASLADTESLSLSYGTNANLYNLSRIAIDQFQQSKAVDTNLLTRLTQGLDKLLGQQQGNNSTAYTLANVAWLIHQLPEEPVTPKTELNTLEQAITQWHQTMYFQKRAYNYYRKALSLLDKTTLSAHQKFTLTLMLKLNLLQLAYESENQTEYQTLQEALSRLTESPSPEQWLTYLTEAERNDDSSPSSQRLKLLSQAFDSLMSIPVQAYTQQQASVVTPILRLSDDYVSQLIKKGNYNTAFLRAEQLQMRALSTQLYHQLGQDFFLTRMDDYHDDLSGLFNDMQAALSDPAQSDNFEELAAELDDTLEGVAEEHPFALAYLKQFAPTKQDWKNVVSPTKPYFKLLSIRGRLYGFLQEGKSLHFFSENQLSQGDQWVKLLEPAEQIYLSTPDLLLQPSDSAEKLKAVLRQISEMEKPISYVSTFYDIYNGYQQRTLFYTDVTAPTDTFSKFEALLSPQNDSAEVPVKFSLLKPASVKTLNSLISSSPYNHYRLTLSETQGVREQLSLTQLGKGSHHTAILLNPKANTAVLRAGLSRAGFPHILVATAPVNDEKSAEFLSLYFTYLADLPPVEALDAASEEVFAEGVKPFVHYGYAGMDDTQKARFASQRYKQSLKRAISRFKKHDYKNALSALEQSLTMINFTKRQADAASLRKLAVDAAFKMGDYPKAIFHQKRLLERVKHKKNTELLPETLYRLGILYSRAEDFENATAYLNKAIKLWTDADELDRLAAGRATLGVVSENSGAYSDALKNFNASFKLYEEIDEAGDVALQNRRIGRIYYLRLNRYQQARQHFNAALAQYKALENKIGETETHYEIGLTYEKVGLFEEADAQYLAGKAIATQLNDVRLLATGNLYLANTAWFRGNYQSALESLSLARKQAKQANDKQLPIMIENTRGLIYWTLNDSDKSLLHLDKAVALAKAANIKTELASSLNNLGLVYRQKGQYAKSLELFNQAKAIDVALNSRWGLGYDFRNIGMSQLKLGKLKQAEANFILSEKTSAAIHNTTNQVKALLELGNINRALNKPDKASQFYENAFQQAIKFDIKEVAWRAAAGKAGLLDKNGNSQGAFDAYDKAITIVEGMRAALKIDELRNSYQANKLDLYRDTVSLLVRMGQTEKAFNYLERARSRSFIDLLGNQKIPLKNIADKKSIKNIKNLYQRVSALQKEISSYDKVPAKLLAAYQKAKVTYDEALLTLKEDNPQLSSFVSVSPLKLKGVQALLEPRVGLLSYMVTKHTTFIWLITHNNMHFSQVAVDEKTLTKQVSSYRHDIQIKAPVSTELTSLYQTLIKPIEQDINALDYLGIIPDGPLHFLSFSALKSEQGYLIDQIPLFYTPSASVLKFTLAKRKASKQTRVLAIGNPNLGNYNYDLPLAELEAKSIRWDYPDMDILTGKKATKEWFVKNISNYGIIHLAAHGEFNDFNPMLSSLWLASDTPANRKLTVKEVFSLDIKADLVTLSACQTGLGKLEAGELIGLNRAFIYAGTHALISSLWRVDDLSTSVLMKHFYRNYKIQNKADSLRQAQLIVKKRFPHPTFWAGLSLVGDYQ